MSIVEQNSIDNQFLTFYVAGEVYALSVLNIKEILEYSIITQVPLMDACISGVTNVRGSVIPVINLGIRLGVIESQTINKRSSIIIVKKEDKLNSFNVGLIVDEVNKVYEIFTKEQEDAPTFGSKIRKDFIEHIGKIDGQFFPILNASTLIDIEELSKVHNVKDMG